MDKRPPFPRDFELYVASRSPRRHSLLSDVGMPFTVVAADADESLGGASAGVLAESNAVAKVRGARLPASVEPGAYVLGSDTLVAVGRKVMGKPSSSAEAAAMLGSLSGRTHRVVSGVALGRTGGIGPGASLKAVRVANAVTKVTFRALERSQIEAYVASDEWRDKAGAYAVQGLAGFFVTRLQGEYSNVVGLPLSLLYGLLRDSGFDPLCREWLSGSREP